MMDKTITLITRENCVYCDNAKKILRELNKDYIEKKIGVDIPRESALKMIEGTGFNNTLPLALVDDELIGNYQNFLDYVFPPKVNSDAGT
jgi:glutaredoxin